MQKYSHNIGNLLARALQKWNKHLVTAFEQAGFFDIKPSYGAIFILLFEADGLPISAIIERSSLSKQTISGYLRELKNKHYVEISKSEKDERAMKIYLAPKGKNFKRVATKILTEMNRNIYKSLGKQQCSQLQELLSKYLSIK